MTASEEYLTHADECVRLASPTNNDLLKYALLSLWQAYLRTAEKLQQRENECEDR
ncbi:MAG: hypothetical protein KGJ79_17770 [Alphaproteobacteria bacterium]|nr:hypothetical protein [Alphaproteobacteria bacterium]MDE2492324.1 hypothetical protein [Alphaproteobacteria bacterium]